jgi:hypothetical protein
MVCGACAEKRIELVRPPVALTECAAEPAAPDLPPVPWGAAEARAVQMMRDATTLAYVLALRSAWGDCSADVAGVKAWSEALK